MQPEAVINLFDIPAEQCLILYVGIEVNPQSDLGT